MTKGFKWVLYTVVVLLAILALLSGGKTIYYFLFTTGMIWLTMYLLVSHNERNLYILYYASENVIRSGDKINIDYKISNTSFVPISHAVIEFKLDKNMGTESSLKEIAYFGNFDRINFSKEIVCKYRGYYRVGQVKVSIYDPLMMYKRQIDFNKPIDITVYPRVLPLKQKHRQSQDFYGTLKSARRTIEDRTNIINIRPYTLGDPLKNIHWKLTAKTGELHTKEFEQTVSTKLVILMDGEHTESFDRDKEEIMVSFCASLVNEVLQESLKFKLIINDQNNTLLEGADPGDFQGILEALTKFESDSDTAFHHFLNRHLNEATQVKSETVVIITPHITEALAEVISRYHGQLMIYTFAMKRPEDKELLTRIQNRNIKVTTIDQLMEVAYGQ